MRFECTAGNYGSTYAPVGSVACSKDLNDHPNFCSVLNTEHPDFSAMYIYFPDYETAVYKSPDTVHFMGKDYETMMETYKEVVD